ncbi:MAG: cardiolipin synthase [Desulfobacterales bacterium]|nr:cardiolipin synthase [Desulfobacterales bacterium]MBF0395837.1 cardiolipin synthase [Desulfobacterales bacterium]
MSKYYLFLFILEIVVASITAVHVILNKRNPRSGVLWVVVSFALPFIGPLLYFILGFNRTQRRAHRIMSKRSANSFNLDLLCKEIRSESYPNFSLQFGQLEPLMRLTDHISYYSLTCGNLIEPLYNGEQAFPAMLNAISKAKYSITCCSYIFDYDKIGSQFIEAFSNAIKRGVKVHLLIDGIGGYWYFSKVYRRLRKCGVYPASFAPLGLLPSRLAHFNLRNHRKILVIDGEIGFSGGMNISAHHMAEDPENRKPVADIHFRMQGPIVSQLQRVFAEDWFFATKEVIEGKIYFPEINNYGNSLARGITSGPDENLNNLFWTIVGACQTARKSIRIMTPYFIPDQSIISAINCASMRGVDVKIVLPRCGDIVFIQWAANSYLWEFLEYKVRIWRHEPPFHHNKLFVIDEMWSLIGSGNIDPRSLRLNFEFNVEIYDQKISSELADYIDHTASLGEEIILEKIQNRSLFLRVRDGFVKLFSPYL